jgi:hypothetical protein
MQFLNPDGIESANNRSQLRCSMGRKKSLNRHLFKAPSAVLNGLDISKAGAEKLLTAELVILCDAIKGIFRCVLSDDGAVLLG